MEILEINFDIFCISAIRYISIKDHGLKYVKKNIQVIWKTFVEIFFFIVNVMQNIITTYGVYFSRECILIGNFRISENGEYFHNASYFSE